MYNPLEYRATQKGPITWILSTLEIPVWNSNHFKTNDLKESFTKHSILKVILNTTYNYKYDINVMIISNKIYY